MGWEGGRGGGGFRSAPIAGNELTEGANDHDHDHNDDD